MTEPEMMGSVAPFGVARRRVGGAGVSRRGVLGSIAAAAAVVASGCAARGESPPAETGAAVAADPGTPDAAIQALAEGNDRW